MMRHGPRLWITSASQRPLIVAFRLFHTLKVELVHQCQWTTQAEARQALFGYIEGYYNRHRMHSAVGYLTPEQAEQRMTG